MEAGDGGPLARISSQSDGESWRINSASWGYKVMPPTQALPGASEVGWKPTFQPCDNR